MRIPRYGIKTVLIAFTVVALWLFTLRDFVAANEIRTAVLFIVALTAGIAAVCHRGQQRAFWAGFFVAMILVGGPVWPPNRPLIPNVNIAARGWTEALFQTTRISFITFNAVFYSMKAILLLAISTVAGYAAARVYDQSRS